MGKYFDVNIVSQGAPRINKGMIEKETNGIAAIAVDLHSKYCEIDFFGSDDDITQIAIGANNESLHIHKEISKNESTLISFPQFKGWDLFCASLTRYTLRICLIKNSKP